MYMVITSNVTDTNSLRLGSPNSAGKRVLIK